MTTIRKPELGQISNLAHYISQEDWFKMQFGDDTELFTALNKATLGQFNYIKQCRHRKRPMKIRDILINLGLKPQQLESR